MTGQEYLIIASNDPHRRAQLEAKIPEGARWLRIPFAGPAAVFAEVACPYVAHPGSSAVLMGRAFHRLGPGEHDFRGSERSAQDLFDQYWGAFIVVSADGGRLQIARDPSSAMPCYYSRMAGALVIASSLTALMKAGLVAPSVAIDRVADCLYRAELPSDVTALIGVKELLPGDCLTIDGAEIGVSPLWSPWNHVAVDPAMTFADHAARVRAVVQNSVTASSRFSRNILLGLSGGLDSSILAACLAAGTCQPLCVTLSTQDAEGDERAYARSIADHFGLCLIEACYALLDIDIDRPARPDLPRPTGRIIAQGYNATIARVAEEHGIEAFFTGNGGDNVFAFSQSAAAIVDRFLYEGPSPGSWSTARDICHLTGCSLLEAGRAAWRILRRPRRYRWRPDRRFLAESLISTLDAQPLDHPWLEAPVDALPGKAAHIASLLRIQRHLDGTGQLDAVAVINPLMSRPVIETCLGIPSWMWCRDGRNRAVAREAFRGAMPPQIVNRISKGGPDGFGRQIVERFRRRIRERLLDGNLAQAGVIDRPALERRLGDDRPDWGADQVRLLELLEAEAWIDHWRAR